VSPRLYGAETAREAKEIADDANTVWINTDAICLSGTEGRNVNIQFHVQSDEWKNRRIIQGTAVPGVSAGTARTVHRRP